MRTSILRLAALGAASLACLVSTESALAQAAPDDGGMVKVSPNGSTTATGAVVIHSPAAGEVITQNLSLSNPPREHRGRVADGSITLNLPPGQWRVGVEFDSGAGDYREVRVDPAFRAEVTLQTWQGARSGAHFGFMAYGTGTYGFDTAEFGGGPLVRGFVNFGGTGTIDVQVGGQIGARFNSLVADATTDPTIEASLVADFVWNTRSGVYRPYFGGRLGGWFGGFRRCATPDTELLGCPTQVEGSALPAFAVEGSLLHFSVGPRRNFDIDFGQDITFLLDTIGEEGTRIFLGLNLGVGAVFY